MLIAKFERLEKSRSAGDFNAKWNDIIDSYGREKKAFAFIHTRLYSQDEWVIHLSGKNSSGML